MTKTIQNLASEVLKNLHTQKRDDGSEYVSLKDDHKQWMQDLCRAAHGSMLPDDQRYKMIQEALSAISEAGDAEELDDLVFRIEADIYTSDLLAWVSSAISRADYVDEAVNAGLVDVSDFSLVATLQAGQAQEKQEVFALIRDGLEEVMTDLELDAE